MSIRKKIVLYVSATVISLTLVSSVIIYLLFSAYREEDFQQTQNEKIRLTIEFISQYKAMTEELTRIMDKLTIHDFYDEKMMIFDNNKKLIYQSIDDLPIQQYEELINGLSPAHQWIETKQGKYDIVAVYVESEHTHFYAISKALDKAGYSKIYFLRNTLIAITLIISLVVLVISYYLSAHISKPITGLADQLSSFDINDPNISPLAIESSSFELEHLTEKFNQLVNRTNETFAFQKHAIQHISHELKTPVAVIVSELEKAKAANTPEEKNAIIHNQLGRAKALGEIITVLLEISKIEAGQPVRKEAVRLDEIIFELINEWAMIQPAFQFEVHFTPELFDDKKLVLVANKLLIRQAFFNMMDNCIKYSLDNKAIIQFDGTREKEVSISFINYGHPIEADEKKYLFDHFFRSKNYPAIPGFGLGLVLTQKVVHLHNGLISYSNPSAKQNVFELRFLLS